MRDAGGRPRTDVLLLGPVGVRHGDEWLAPPSGLLRALLAALALVDGREITPEALLDSVWSRRVVTSPQSTVAVAVHRLRQWLRSNVGASVTVTRSASGYRMDLSSGYVDVARFRQLVVAARDTGAAERAALLGEALALWRGPALGEIPASYSDSMSVAALDQERRTASLDLCQALQSTGRPAPAVGVLTPLTERLPLDEPVHAALIEALAAAGRQAEALQVYEDVRLRLADELGVDPSAQLRAAHSRVLRQEVPPGKQRVVEAAWAIPAQLPPDILSFAGRRALLRRLDRLVERREHSAVSVIAGTAGVGKTALAVRWAHGARGRFPDGQLYVDLRGYASTPPARPLDVLARFLRALGVAPESVPVDLAEATAMYRTVVADRRLLVLLDNAVDADQVRPLLPGGPGCYTVVTSRSRLAGLAAADGATVLPLEVLSPAEARSLLEHFLGERRVTAAAAEAAELASACAYLPLALRIAAAELLVLTTRTLGEYVAGLAAGDRIAVLSIEGDTGSAVGIALERSYSGLPAEAQQLFRLIGLSPGPDITGGAAAALAGADAAPALLQRLVDAHLLDADGDRYRFHDLLRSYAAGLAVAVDGARECGAAVERLFSWYLAHADAAVTLLYPHVWRLPLPDLGVHAAFGDSAAALAWLENERANMVACVRHAAEHGPRRYAWLLADTLRAYVWLRRYTVEWLALAKAGLAGASGEADVFAEAAMWQSLAFAATILHSPEAVERYETAIDLARQASWRFGEAKALGNLGRTHADRGQLDAAVVHLRQSLAINEEIGARHSQAADLGNLGIVSAEQGKLAQAAEFHARALDLFEEIGSRGACATAINNLAYVYHAMGDLPRALPLVEQALAFHREVGGRVGESFGLGTLAAIRRDQGMPQQALEHARAGLVLIREAGDARTEAEVLNVLSSIHLARGDSRASVDCYRQAYGIARGARSPLPEVEALVGIADALCRQGDGAGAVTTADQALRRSRETGFRLLEAHALASLADARVVLGEASSAARAAERARHLYRESGCRPGLERIARVMGAIRSLADSG